MSRDASSSRAVAQGRIAETLQTLMEAAERFVNSVRRWKKTDQKRHALLDVITQAQWLLGRTFRRQATGVDGDGT